jgi:hypothetical protein
VSFHHDRVREELKASSILGSKDLTESLRTEMVVVIGVMFECQSVARTMVLSLVSALVLVLVLVLPKAEGVVHL